ncbi:MAG: 50S ribosomal protein L11 methyltransferase [Candidatus Micrarchaeota archaeon]|nr:50S ribosomal protein L11 methyltransferase [Candidatus Micrarchaeota archaeon]
MKNKLAGWAASIRNLWMMRQLNAARFGEILNEATIYGTPEAGRVHFNGRLATFAFLGRKLTLREGEVELVEVFFHDIYGRLDVKGKTVIDAGCGVGDTPIVFSLRGANHVIGYDANEKRIETAKWNVGRNCIKNTDLSCRFIKSLAELPFGEALKIDIEGGEHEIFREAEDRDILKFDEIIMECHGGYNDIEGRLRGLGYETEIYNPTFNGRNVMLYAKKAGGKR